MIYLRHQGTNWSTTAFPSVCIDSCYVNLLENIICWGNLCVQSNLRRNIDMKLLSIFTKTTQTFLRISAAKRWSVKYKARGEHYAQKPLEWAKHTPRQMFSFCFRHKIYEGFEILLVNVSRPFFIPSLQLAGKYLCGASSDLLQRSIGTY